MWSLEAKKEQQLRPYRDVIARIIAGRINMLQRSIVGILQRWDRSTTVMQKKIVLIVFCIVCSGYCTFLLGDALFAKTGATAIRFEPIPAVAQPPPFYRPKDSIRSGDASRLGTKPNQPLKNNK